MWLLDNNLPKQLVKFLRSKSITSITAATKGWAELTNGALVKAASESGFICILTKDVKFYESAKNAIVKYPQMSVVLITIEQAPSQKYIQMFSDAWDILPIAAVAGKLIVWPH